MTVDEWHAIKNWIEKRIQLETMENTIRSSSQMSTLALESYSDAVNRAEMDICKRLTPDTEPGR